MSAPACQCPACGQALPEAPLEALRAACSPQMASILDIIAAEPGVTSYQFQHRLGLPRSGTQLRRLRERIAPLGWAVEVAARGSRGARGYRLVRLAGAGQR